MIKCHLSTMMGTRKLKISDLVSEAGLSRSTVTGLYHETTQRFDGPVLGKLCEVFDCQVGDLLEYVPDQE